LCDQVALAVLRHIAESGRGVLAVNAALALIPTEDLLELNSLVLVE
jgi:hypothetical protein